MRSIYFVVALLCLNLTACSKQIFDESKSENQEFIPVSIKTMTFEEAFTANVRPTKVPEKYVVSFVWPKLQENQKLRIQTDLELAIVGSEQTTFNHEVSHNQILHYSFEVIDESDSVVQKISKSVTVPRDYVVRHGQNHFLEDTNLNVHRLFINQDYSLITNGFNVEINADELLSEKGTIATFDLNSRAESGAHGKNGGEIKLNIQKALGLLKIHMRGQHGGHGITGAPFSFRAPDGNPPKSGSEMCESPGAGRDRLRSITKPLRHCECVRDGKNGTDGHQGAQGNPGGPAGNGGSTGELKLNIKDGSGFKIETTRVVGESGQRGVGGPGQPGGIAPEGSGKCLGKKGNNGFHGPLGDEGPSGISGVFQTTCIQIESEARNECF